MNLPAFHPDLPPWLWTVLTVVIALATSPVLASLVAKRWGRKIDQAAADAKRAAESASIAEREVTRNSGSSMKDGLDRQERLLQSVLEEQARQGAEFSTSIREIRGDLSGLRQEMRQEREERSHLGERLTDLERPPRNGRPLTP